MRFKGLDLNLLVALDVLVEERSVSRAAARMHLSQPAMSAALNRLREYFNDPILAAHGKKMIPTPHAIRLHDMLRGFLTGVDTVVSASASFEPAISQRRFRIAVSDYLAIVLFTNLIPHLERLAPRISLELVSPSEKMLMMLDQGEFDLIITPDDHISPDHPAELLFEERHVVAGWRRNPLVKKPISAGKFFAASHVVVEIDRLRSSSFAETHLRKMNRERRVELFVSSFALAPEMLINTQRLTVMHERLAQAFAKRIAISYVDLPFDFPVMREMLQYHRTRSSDAGLRWLIAQIRAVVDHPPN